MNRSGSRSTRRASRVAPLVGVTFLLGALALGSGCATGETTLRREAPDLSKGVWREDALHCGRGQCKKLFRVVVDKPTTIVVEASAPSDPLLPDFYIVLEDSEGHAIGDDREAQKRPRKIVRKLEPGLYYVRVGGQDKKGDQLSYKLRAYEQRARTTRSSGGRKTRTKKSIPTPPPVVVPVLVESEVLEVERDGGEPTAILIEAGTGSGLEPGQSGELFEGDDVIGQIVIIDVYAAGSRARIVGGLSAPITLDTRVRVEK
jgi:hypothetical protein